MLWALCSVYYKETDPLTSRVFMHGSTHRSTLLADMAHPAVTHPHHSSETCRLFFSLPVSLSSPRDSD